MYKVFFNDRKIVISENADITLNKFVNVEENFHSVNDVIHWFSDFILSDQKEAILSADNVDSFWKNEFVPSFKFIRAAGGVVIRNNELLFIFRNEKWDLPKGKIDNTESLEKAALREVEEECGISGHEIVRKLPSTFHIYESPYEKTKGIWILKETYWFEMHYSGIENGKPQIEENITETRWFERKDLKAVLANTYENLKQVIELYFV